MAVDGASAVAAGQGGTASFGPVLFFGLTAVALISHTDDTPPLPNPSDTMEFAADGLARPVEALIEPTPPTAQIVQVAALALPDLSAATVVVAPVQTTRAVLSLNVPVPREEIILEVAPVPAAEPPVIMEFAGRFEPEMMAPILELADLTDVDAGPVPEPKPLALANPVARLNPEPPELSTLPVPDAVLEIASFPPSVGRIRGFAAPPAVADPDADLTQRPALIWANVTGQLVNARAGPGLDFESLAQFNPGRRVIITDRSGDWTRINVLDADGGPLIAWMFGAFLEED